MRVKFELAMAAVLMNSAQAFAGPAPAPASRPADFCQAAAYRAAAGTVPPGSVMTGIFSLTPPPQARDRSVGSVVMIGEVSGHEFSIAVHVRYIRSIHTCQVLQVNNLDWGDHI